MSIAEKLTTVAENVEVVYQAGRDDEHYRFWNTFHENAESRKYYRTFTCGFDNTNFYPIREIWFGSYTFYDTDITNLLNGLAENDYTGEFEGDFKYKVLPNMSSTFAYSNIQIIPDLSLNRVDTGEQIVLTLTFGHSYDLTSIMGLYIDENTILSNTFINNRSLRDITIHGTIASDIDFLSSPLSEESCMSIIDALKDFTGTGEEYTRTLRVKSEVSTLLESTVYDGKLLMEIVYDKKWNVE